eukprot:434600-Alexandrium_andersonii.AAC.1
MSASLVGSEMCIRDRPKASSPVPLSRAANRGGPVRRNQAKAPASVRTSSCLLYTSDAADDM